MPLSIATGICNVSFGFFRVKGMGNHVEENFARICFSRGNWRVATGDFHDELRANRGA